MSSFRRCCSACFLLYVADGRRAGRVAVVVVVVTGLPLRVGGADAARAVFRCRRAACSPTAVCAPNLGSIAGVGPRSRAAGRDVGRSPSGASPARCRSCSRSSPRWRRSCWAGRAGLRPHRARRRRPRAFAPCCSANLLFARAGSPPRSHPSSVSISRVRGAASWPADRPARRACRSCSRRTSSAKLGVDAPPSCAWGTEALWESEERYRRMVDDIPVMVFRFSAEGAPDLRQPDPVRVLRARQQGRSSVSPCSPPSTPTRRDQLWTKVRALDGRPSPTVEVVAHATPSQGPTADSAACSAGSSAASSPRTAAASRIRRWERTSRARAISKRG